MWKVIRSIVGLIILVFVATVIAILYTIMQHNTYPVGQGEFKVYGATNGGSASITYNSDNDGGQFIFVQDAALPWTKPLVVSFAGKSAQLSANSMNGVPITCELWVDGILVSKTTDNANVYCSYLPPQPNRARPR